MELINFNIKSEIYYCAFISSLASFFFWLFFIGRDNCAKDIGTGTQNPG